jgi:ribonuclease HII
LIRRSPRGLSPIPRHSPGSTHQLRVSFRLLLASRAAQRHSQPVPNRRAVDRFEFERQLVAQGYHPLAGVDEAGRGPLAGPVVAAAVILPIGWIHHGLPKDLIGLNDSKQLRHTQRERFFERILHHQLPFAVAEVDPPTIDATNILRATHSAMNLALSRLDPAPVHVLVDGLFVRAMSFPQTALVQGDSRSYTIAAASILAKVLRDRAMSELDRLYPGYGFAVHKGYPTPQHLEALRRLGPSPAHRRSFAPLRHAQTELFPAHVALVPHPAQT